MEILVLGGTHHVGRCIVEAARAKGHSVTILNRGVSAAPPSGVIALQADRERPETVREALRRGEWDAAFDTWSGAPRAVNDACVQLIGSVGHYVYVSSRSVYEWPMPDDQDETGPVVAADPESDDASDYAACKRGGEIAVEASFADRFLIARAGLILGPYERVGRLPWWLLRVSQGGPVLCPGPRTRPLQYIDGRDLAEWLIDATGRRVAGVFNAVSRPGHTTMGELIDTAIAVTRADCRTVWASPEYLAESGVQPWTELPIWLPPDGPSSGMHSANVDVAYAAGLRCRPVHETVVDTWRWLQAEPYPGPVRPLGLAPEREAELLARLETDL